MMKLYASCLKELTLIYRDKAGLAILFVMPMALVLVITLIQNNVLDNQSQIDILLINQDQKALGDVVEKGLADSEFFSVKKNLDGSSLTPDSLKLAIAKGDFQIGIIIHSGATDMLQKNAGLLIEKNNLIKDQKVSLILDPVIQSALKSAIENALHRLIQSEEVRSIIQGLMKPRSTEFGQDNEKTIEPIALVGIHQEYASENNLMMVKPNAVQHNVPAWTLFGIFFIALPISSSLLRERQEGTLTRLFTMPVPFSIFLLGKILSYVLINMMQLGLMLWVGIAVLPMFGTPVLELGNRPDLIIAVGLCASLAATGFGIMLGTLARNYEQASMVGPISIVIAAALGGIMVPVFLMPKFMQPLSIISPLRWGHESFVDIFVRGADWVSLAPNMISLILFFLTTLLVAIVFLLREE